MENINSTNPNVDPNVEVQGQGEGVEAGASADTTTYTENQVLEMIQKEADKRVSQALAKQQYKFEQKLAEAEKLKAMDESQRKEYEFDKRIEEFEEKEKQFTIIQNKLEASKVMSSRGLPVSFVDYIVAEDAETMMTNINTLETAFKSAVADAVSAKLASPTPKTGNVLQTGLTRDQFIKMSAAQQADLYKTNPELYRQMTQR